VRVFPPKTGAAHRYPAHTQTPYHANPPTPARSHLRRLCEGWRLHLAGDELKRLSHPPTAYVNPRVASNHAIPMGQ
jgi:hypothetical protein